jgi:hypothetical protein
MQKPIYKKEKNINIYKLITITQTNPIKLNALLNVEMFQSHIIKFSFTLFSPPRNNYPPSIKLKFIPTKQSKNKVSLKYLLVELNE